jgi:hypothetical protein
MLQITAVIKFTHIRFISYFKSLALQVYDVFGTAMTAPSITVPNILLIEKPDLATRYILPV